MMKKQIILPVLSSLRTDDERYMYEALKQAKKAFEMDEVPVGSVLVFRGEIIAKGYNQVELLQDATAHAELLCISAASEALHNWRLQDCTLYSTLEPCTMCAGAILLSRIKRVVWGARDIRQGAHGSWVNVFDVPHPIHRLEVTTGVLEEYCEVIMKKFFQEKRSEKNAERTTNT